MRREIASIQYLRGIAAMMVVFAHANAQFPSPTHLVFRNLGWSGVDLFFVISGFVMTYIVAARPMKPGEFLRRRITRIAPLYWVVTAITAVLIIAMPYLFQHSQFTWKEFVSSLLFIPFRNPGSNDIAPLFKLGWTLNYEMFYYFCFAAFLFLKPWYRLFALCGIFGTIVFIQAVCSSDWAPLEFYGSPMTFEFILGSLLGCIYVSNLIARIPHWVAYVLIALGFGAMIAGGITPDLSHREVERGLPACFIVLGLLALEQYVTLTNKWLHSLGDATYSIYLTHLYIVMMMYRVVRHVPIDSMLSYIIPLVSLLVCAVAGIAVYNVAEQRLIAAAKELFVPHSAGLAA